MAAAYNARRAKRPLGRRLQPRLILIPTILMGDTLPILVECTLVQRSGRSGAAFPGLDSVNTFGSAMLLFLREVLASEFGQAARLPSLLSQHDYRGTAYLYGLRGATTSGPAPAAQPRQPAATLRSGCRWSMFLAGLSGLLALGFEIAWFAFFPWLRRIAPALALCSSIFLA